MLAEADALGAQEVVGFWRIPDEAPGACRLSVFAGTSFLPRWTVILSECEGLVLAAAGSRVVLVDRHGLAQVFDRADGRPVGIIPLAERTQRLCADPMGRALVGVRLEGDTLLDLDLESGVARASTVPCPDRDLLNCHDVGEGCESPDRWRDGGRAGIYVSYVMREGTTVVGVGQRYPGTAVPMLVGIDPSTRATRWIEPVPSRDLLAAESHRPRSAAMHGGRLFVAYRGSDRRLLLANFDGATGSRSWEIDLEPHCQDAHEAKVRAGGSRVYVECGPSLRVFDAASGRLVGSIREIPVE